MKTQIIIVLLSLLNTALSAQNELQYFKEGIVAHESGDFENSIKLLSKALEQDSQNAEIYYARGTSNLSLSQFENAKSDFSKALEIDSNYLDAIYNRSICSASLGYNKQALTDINRVLKIKNDYPSGLTLRGQIKNIMNDSQGACLDFEKAKLQGDQEAIIYISKFCNKTSSEKESLILNWESNWKEQPPQENNQMKFVEYLRDNESFENWSELGTVITYKNVTGKDVESSAKALFNQTKQKCPQSKFTIIDVNMKIEYPWIIFSIESPVSGSYESPESQVWLYIQGNTSLYLANRAIKSDKITTEQKEEWTQFFKEAIVISK